jgi:hypothetical protein
VNLHETTDAKVWAEEFVKALEANPSIATDVGTMLGWFANAMMTMHDRTINHMSEREVKAIGWLSAELAGRSGAWDGKAPEWFPQPPAWLDLWHKAMAEV